MLPRSAAEGTLQAWLYVYSSATISRSLISAVLFQAERTFRPFFNWTAKFISPESAEADSRYRLFKSLSYPE